MSLTRRLALGLLTIVLAACSARPAPALDADHDPESGVSTVTAVDQWTFRDSLLVSAPPDRPAPKLPSCARTPLPKDWVRHENSLTGDLSWSTLDRSNAPSAAIYLDSSSTVCGTPVGVHLDPSIGTPVTVRAYRLGWYGGAGARVVWESTPVLPAPATGAPASPINGLPSPGWATTLSLPVGPTWTPGLYLITTVVNGVVSGGAPLVVRSGLPSAALVMVHSTLTWAAYNDYGGTSLYRGAHGRADRALRTDLARPLAGAGLVQFLVNEVPLTQFAERIGVAVDHITDLDLDSWPSLVAGRGAIVLAGHTEYVTGRMYDAITAARNAGVNIADLGANEIYWQVRLGRDSTGTAKSMFVARTLAQDPLANAKPEEATVQWAAAPVGRDPTAVIGQGYGAVQVRGSSAVLSMPGWLMPGTGLALGVVLQNIVANEGDGIHGSSRATPPNLQVIFGAVVTHKGYRPEPVTTTYYSAPSGAAVFAAGITYWTCNLNDACPNGLGAASLARFELRALTANLLVAFQTPRFGASHPSVRLLPRSTAALQRLLPKAAIGQYGPGV